MFFIIDDSILNKEIQSIRVHRVCAWLSLTNLSGNKHISLCTIASVRCASVFLFVKEGGGQWDMAAQHLCILQWSRCDAPTFSSASASAAGQYAEIKEQKYKLNQFSKGEVPTATGRIWCILG